MLPDVDVIIPTRDRPALLRSAVRSVLASEYGGNIRVLVVFDQSPPDAALVEEPALGLAPGRTVDVVENTRKPGLAGARNTGLMFASAELVAFCDDDDVWLPRKLDQQVQALIDHPSADFVCCGIDVFYDGRSHPRVLDMSEITLTDLLRDRLTELHPSTFVMRRKSVVDGFGLVEEEIPGSYAEDYELLLRAARDQPIRNIPEVGVRVLWSTGSYFSARWSTIQSALTWLLERYPEFNDVPHGQARIDGQIAFAAAAEGNRKAAGRWAWRAFRCSPIEPRTYLALAVAAGVSPDWVLRQLHHRGHGL